MFLTLGSVFDSSPNIHSFTRIQLNTLFSCCTVTLRAVYVAIFGQNYKRLEHAELMDGPQRSGWCFFFSGHLILVFSANLVAIGIHCNSCELKLTTASSSVVKDAMYHLCKSTGGACLVRVNHLKERAEQTIRSSVWRKQMCLVCRGERRSWTSTKFTELQQWSPPHTPLHLIHPVCSA